jgi:aminoglycoside phosphotransferase (APT) family kinase protein
MDAIPSDLRRALSSTLQDGSWQASEPTHRGLSGIPLFRIACEQGIFALRAWPPTYTSLEKVIRWGKVCERFEEAGFESDSPFPKPLKWTEGLPSLTSPSHTTLIPAAGWFWTLTRWVPGAPLSRPQMNDEMCSRLIGFLARLHRVCQTVECTEAVSLGILERVKALQDSNWQNRFRGADDSDFERYESVLQSVRREYATWTSLLRSMSQRPYLVHWIVRDLWRENILVSDDRNRMWVVDLGASRVEAPFFDLVRLLGSLQPTRARWQEAVQQYAELAPRELPLSSSQLWELHRISTAIGLRYWNRSLTQENCAEGLANNLARERFRELLSIWETANSDHDNIAPLRDG